MKRLATSVLAAAVLGGTLQASDVRPRLVVGIVVDQLRTDYIEYLRDYFGERGFKTLLTDGVYMPDVEFKPSRLDGVSSTTMLVTGAYPSQTGIPSAYIYDGTSLQGRLFPAMAGSQASLLTNDSFTPAPISLTTLADEIAVEADQRGGDARIYAVSADPQQAIALAGHAGDGAFWINNTSGNWATTSYYGSMPSAVSSRNFRNSISQRLDTMKWAPSAELKSSGLLPPSLGKGGGTFKHTFSRQDRDVYKKFSATPLGNAEVTDVAIDLLGAMSLGSTPGQTDMLGVGYTLAPFKFTATSSGQAELADSYLRLDRQLARLTEAVEKQVGAGNALIWLSSTGFFEETSPSGQRLRLPGGDFSVRKARSLVNSYLSAKYGSGEYVSTIREAQVYFDHRLLERLNERPEVVIADARTFLTKMSGIEEAYTIDQLLNAPGGEEERLRLSIDTARSGDIILGFTPGWEIHYDEQVPAQTVQWRATPVMTPAFILNPGTPARTIDTPVEATALAPTISGALHIRSPNGAKSRGIRL